MLHKHFWQSNSLDLVPLLFNTPRTEVHTPIGALVLVMRCTWSFCVQR